MRSQPNIVILQLVDDAPSTKILGKVKINTGLLHIIPFYCLQGLNQNISTTSVLVRIYVFNLFR